MADDFRLTDEYISELAEDFHAGRFPEDSLADSIMHLDNFDAIQFYRKLYEKLNAAERARFNIWLDAASGGEEVE